MKDVEKAAPVGVGAMALQAGVPSHRIDYAIKRLGIRPIALLGRYRAYSPEDAQRVIAAIRRIDAARAMMAGESEFDRNA